MTTSIPHDSPSTNTPSLNNMTDDKEFLISWKALQDALGEDDEWVRGILTTVATPNIFSCLPVANIIEALRRMEAIKVAQGTVLMEQGDDVDNFYIIKEGQVEIWQSGLYDDEQQLVAKRGAGYPIGEEALVMNGRRSATVKMLTDATLLRLPGEDFKELIEKPTVAEVNPAAAYDLLNNAGYRVLDVRYEEEFEDEHLPSSQLLPLPELRGRLAEIDPQQRYVAVCMSGKRSAVATMILRQNGITAVSMQGGLQEWPYQLVS